MQPSETSSLIRGSNDSQHPSSSSERGTIVWGCLATFMILAIATLIITIPRSHKWNSPTNNLSDHAKTNTSSTLVIEVERKRDTHSPDTIDCNDGYYSKRTLQLAYELPFAALFKDNQATRKFEASSVVLSDDKNTVYAICDSSWAVSKFGIQLTPIDDGNILLGDVDRVKDEDSGYESIFLDGGKAYVVRESINHMEGKSDNLTGYHAIIEELQFTNDNSYSIVRKCSSEYQFEGDSKGFEGAEGIHDLNNSLLVLALCEGNHCSEQRHFKQDMGHGKIVVMRQIIKKDGSCAWNTIRKLHIPKSARFKDYSDISITRTGKVAITSQENSQLWIGQLVGQQSNGRWDIDALDFDTSVGVVYDFPKNDQCATIYCNIEGIAWINDDTVMAVSDKMKGRGKQDFRCADKDQSVHIFMLP